MNDQEDWDGAVVRDLLTFSSENYGKVRGKILAVSTKCKGAVEQIEEFVLQKALATFCPNHYLTFMPQCAFMKQYLLDIKGGLKVCSKEECEAIGKEYPENLGMFEEPSCVYKFQEGENEEKRRMYISFKPERSGEVNDYDLMKRASCIYVMFA
uniref:FZ domain-containing protein n=1 Tax=Steinernema glaseri TaxID=37863 RepID=A0A1I8A5E7_9BILA